MTKSADIGFLSKDTRLCISLSARPGNFGTRFQNFLYRELGLDFIYKAFQTDDIQGAIQGIRALRIRGAAISMPFKEACIPFLDELNSSARGIQSVNTIVNTDGHLKAFNTDYVAVYQLLKSNHAAAKTSDFVVHGSGGMAKAVVCALRDCGFEKGTVLARNQKTGEALAGQYGYSWRENLGELRPKILVNVTPIGMAGGSEAQELAFPESAVASADVIFDVVALPIETPLIRLARQLGKKVITGGDVTVLQAVEQFVLYTGIRPDDALIARAANFARG